MFTESVNSSHTLLEHERFWGDLRGCTCMLQLDSVTFRSRKGVHVWSSCREEEYDCTKKQLYRHPFWSIGSCFVDVWSCTNLSFTQLLLVQGRLRCVMLVGRRNIMIAQRSSCIDTFFGALRAVLLTSEAAPVLVSPSYFSFMQECTYVLRGGITRLPPQHNH